MNRTLAYFQSISVLDFDSSAADCYQSIINQKIRVGTQELKIAAIVLSSNAVIVTRNFRDFSKVPGLKIEDWSRF